MNFYLKPLTSLPVLLLLASCSNNAKNNKADGEPELNADTSTETEVMRIAAAANLAAVLPDVIDAYKQSKAEHGHNIDHPNTKTNTGKSKIEVTYASSGKLFAQINSGAPYDIFLSADQSYPAKYAEQHQTANDSQKPFTYARGQLALYSSSKPLKGDTIEASRLKNLFESQAAHSAHPIKITIANPQLAPYGASAKTFLQQHGLFDSLNKRKQLIQAENIGQAFQYTHTATTDYGFVALSQLISAKVDPSKYQVLHAESYPAIFQDGIVISDHPQATDFSDYLQSESAQKILAKAGYLTVNN